MWRRFRCARRSVSPVSSRSSVRSCSPRRRLPRRPTTRPQYRVYVFTRGAPTTPLQRRGQGDQGPRQGQRVHRPVQRRPHAVHRGEPGALPRGDPPRRLGRRPQRRPAGRLRGLLHQRRRRAGDPQRDRDRARLGLPDRSPRRPLERPHRQPGRHDQGRGPRPRSVQRAARVLEPNGVLVQLRRQRPRLQPRPRHGHRGPVRRPPAWRSSPGSQAARWASTTRSRGARTSRVAARSTPVSAARRRRSRTPCIARTCLGRSAGRPASPTRSIPTAAPRSSRTTSRPS